MEVLYTGTSVILTCTIELNGAVDSEVRVAGVWRRGGEVVNNSSRVYVSPTTLVHPSVFQMTISVSPLSDSMDSGQYSCHSTITSTPFILFSVGSQQVTLRIDGKKKATNSCVVFDCLQIIYLHRISTTSARCCNC